MTVNDWMLLQPSYNVMSRARVCKLLYLCGGVSVIAIRVRIIGPCPVPNATRQHYLHGQFGANSASCSTSSYVFSWTDPILSAELSQYIKVSQRCHGSIALHCIATMTPLQCCSITLTVSSSFSANDSAYGGRCSTLHCCVMQPMKLAWMFRRYILFTEPGIK